MRILVIPDTQVKPGVPIAHLLWAGRHAADRKPDAVVVIGDHSDMPTLSSYDKGKKSFEGRSYQKDIWAAREAMDALLEPMFQFNERARRFKEKQYRPEMHMLLGNHENRIDRAVNDDRKLEGLISTDDLPYQDWIVHPFLDVLVLDGIAFSHYFTSGVMGRPITSAAALLTKKHMSCFAFHQQGRQIAYGMTADGREMTAIICGSCYEHNEDYLGAQGNNHFRGCYMLYDVRDGRFDELPLTIKYLKEKYGGKNET